MTDDGVMVTWTPEMLARFKEKIANSKGQSYFTFDGNQYYRVYAGLLAEYLEGEFKRRGLKFGKLMNSLSKSTGGNHE